MNKNSYYKKIKEVFEKNNGYAKTKDIVKTGINKYHLYKLLEKNKIIKLKNGLYKWNYPEKNSDEELVEVSKIVSSGVICLLSALSYYELTTTNPWQYYIAIHRDVHKPKLPEYPPIKIFYFSQKQYETGIINREINENKIQIYDMEKTLCDCFRYRNKVGRDIVNEAFKEYVNGKYMNMDKLLKYAEKVGPYNELKKYLELLL